MPIAKTLDNSPKGKIKNQDITNTTPMANKLFKAEISNNDGNVRKSSNAPSKMGKSSVQDVTDWLDGII
ncbi:hypothetical protein AX774_g2746 [Zancudomyces culisetae]|uniref:Uncharacterized protein n=1 Tax=Zancudomyces culisetae TaxID=1213189 RepID=A0A1R1PS67_ZANCU|nr:hypothetical protein AX774_g2746 [Zancudomyces culisetae]|eukprot:OMH83732.1 hypothetical protein AX774_g2746 [Zancudomyces culisetae]